MYGKYFNSSYIDVSYINYLKEIVNVILLSTEELELTMKCYNLSNFFKPVHSENELVNYAISGKAGAFLSSK